MGWGFTTDVVWVVIRKGDGSYLGVFRRKRDAEAFASACPVPVIVIREEL